MADFEYLICDFYEYDHVELKSKRANWDFITGKYRSGSVAASVSVVPAIVSADVPSIVTADVPAIVTADDPAIVTADVLADVGNLGQDEPVVDVFPVLESLSQDVVQLGPRVADLVKRDDQRKTDVLRLESKIDDLLSQNSKILALLESLSA